MPLNYLWCSWLRITNDFHTYIEEKLNSFIRKVWIWSAGLRFSCIYLWTGKNSTFMESTLISNSDYSADLINNFIFQSENFTFLDFFLLAILTSVVCEWALKKCLLVQVCWLWKSQDSSCPLGILHTHYPCDQYIQQRWTSNQAS